MNAKPKQGHDSREALVTAAQELYWRQGVAATTPRQVIELSGVGQGSLYHHFPSKRDLALAAITRTTEETMSSARRVLSSDEAPRERLQNYLARPRDAAAGCRVGRLTADRAVMTDDELGDRVRTYFTDLIDLITEVLLDDGSPREVAERRAMTMVAVVQGGYVLSQALESPDPMEQAITGLLELLDQQ